MEAVPFDATYWPAVQLLQARQYAVPPGDQVPAPAGDGKLLLLHGTQPI